MLSDRDPLPVAIFRTLHLVVSCAFERITQGSRLFKGLKELQCLLEDVIWDVRGSRGESLAQRGDRQIDP